jgi:CubicO group peptidase (beta-lactamase class C family)
VPTLARLLRPLRVAAWSAGLVADRTRGAVRAVERLLDARAPTLFASSGVPGLAVVVRFAEGATVRRAYGTAGVAGPMSTDTVVEALSLSKPVTATCAMALVDRGVLALDEPVWRRLRSWRMPASRAGPGSVDDVTLRRLLSHSAGLNVLGYGRRGPSESPTALDLLARDAEEERTLRIVRAPGSEFAYSGGAFVVVQALVEDATGRPFADVARETVLAPLGMRSSDYEPSPALLQRLSSCHDADGRTLPRDPYAATAASGLYTTAEDLVAFWSAFAEGPRGEPPGRGVVSPATCAQMLAPQVEDPGGGAWGLGFRLKRQRHDLRYLHAGYDEGWHSFAEGLSRRRVVLVLLSNGDRGKDCVPALSRALRTLLYDVAL